MNNILLNVRALAANEKISIDELADRCGLDRMHLKQVSAERVPMTAKDLKALAKYTKVPAENIFVHGYDD